MLPCRGGEGLLRRLFEPLGYAVRVTRHALDERFPVWGESPYYTVELSATTTLSALLKQLYLLMPVLDDDKHYWIEEEEVQKLLRGETWLGSHPEREQIVNRYLKHQKRLAHAALAQLTEADPLESEVAEQLNDAEEAAAERKLSLNEQRHDAVLAVLRSSGAQRVLDLGCSTGRFLKRLLDDRQFEEVVGLDVSHRCLSGT